MYDIAIIGGGPAGTSAAMFTAKAGKKTVLFDHDKGMTKRAWIENHYGAPDIEGPDLIETGHKQAEKLGAEVIKAEVTNVTKNGDKFIIETADQQYEAQYIILSTGLATDLAAKMGVQLKPGTEPRVPKIIDCDSQGKTNIEGVWAAGTVAGVSVHTIITAGDGAKVAINLLSEIKGERHVDHDILKK